MQTTSSFYVLFWLYILNINFDGFTFFTTIATFDIATFDVCFSTLFFWFSIKALSIHLDELFFALF